MSDSPASPASRDPNDAFEIARLRARVAGLEAALERRSVELRTLQRFVCRRDLIAITRLASGLGPQASDQFDIEAWEESPLLTTADIEETLRELWDSTIPKWPRVAR